MLPNVRKKFPPEAWESFKKKKKIPDEQEQSQVQLLGKLKGQNKSKTWV